MSDQHQAFIKTPQQLIVVLALAFIIPIAVILALAALVTSGQRGLSGSDAAVSSRIQPVGRVEMSTSGPSGGLSATPPVAPAASPAPVAASVPLPQAAAVVATVAAPAAGPSVDGKKVYDTSCVACHSTGIAGSPKLGDKAAWTARIAQGMNVLHERAIKGYQGKAGVMPAKGGNIALSDAEVRGAVEYLVAAAK